MKRIDTDNPYISKIIILDEVLSGIDLSSRQLIEGTLTESNKTILLISHEPTENIKFDSTYTLSKGTLIKNIN